MKKRILFVDDESKVLQGLRRMLRSLRREWDMEFAEGGPEALEQLAISPFDVVVSDMRMPGMDGAKLLNEIMKLYPATVRIILSGQCDRQAVLKCVGPAHQFLTKPCDSETLKSTIARACSVRDDMADERYQCMVSRLATVPCHPLVYTELIAELESSQPSIQRITQIVSRDVGMTAKVFQLVSSSFFGTPQRISDPARAVQLLGLDTIKPLALSTEAFIPFEADAMEGGWLEPLMDHSLAVGTAAQAIAEAETEDEVVINDEQMPGMCGGDLLAWVADNCPEIIRILLTGRPSVEAAIRAINEGAVYQFFTKPCNPARLGVAIRKALEHKNLVVKNRQLLDSNRLQLQEREHYRQSLENLTGDFCSDIQEPLLKISNSCRAMEEHYNDIFDLKARTLAQNALDGIEDVRRLVSDLMEHYRSKTPARSTDQTLCDDETAAGELANGAILECSDCTQKA